MVSVGLGGDVTLTHLQFADDTLLLGTKSWLNVRTMRAVLLLFEDVSGLKVNFNKSMLTGVNISDSWLSEAASVINCHRGTIPFVYLGLPIGGDSRKLSFWKPVVDRIVTRLASWNNNLLSSGGRLVLLKSVMSSLPVYFLSFFKAPAGIISSIESIFKSFFWGGGEENRKIAWISWESICIPKEDGGLGVRRVGDFNTSLLGKWCWRMLSEKGGLWYRVLRSRYGEEGGRLKDGGNLSSPWWRTICRVREGVGSGVGSWFEENTRRIVGDGRGTLFWYDTWVGDVPFRSKFPRLFDLAVNKEQTVEEMMRLGWEPGGGAWDWRRRLLAWEEESVRECYVMLHNVVLQASSTNTWWWLLDPIHGYTVRGTYHFLTTSGTGVDRSRVDDVWHRSIPSKVSLFVWRLLRDRLPTKNNLARRRVLQPTDTACSAGCGESETAFHLFLGCDIYSSLWLLVLHWLSISSALPGEIRHHYVHFIHLASLPRLSHHYLRIIWFASVWVIWKERNNRTFNNVTLHPSVLLEKVKLNSFLWIKSKQGAFLYSYHDWWKHHLQCMGVQ